MKKCEELKMNAENCAELKEQTTDETAKRRYERMEDAWNSLAKTQAWLDGDEASLGRKGQ